MNKNQILTAVIIVMCLLLSGCQSTKLKIYPDGTAPWGAKTIYQLYAVVQYADDTYTKPIHYWTVVDITIKKNSIHFRPMGEGCRSYSGEYYFLIETLGWLELLKSPPERVVPITHRCSVKWQNGKRITRE